MAMPSQSPPVAVEQEEEKEEEDHSENTFTVRYYLVPDTRAEERNLVFRTFFLFSTWRRAQEYNRPVNIVDNLLNDLDIVALSNKTAQSPFEQEFGKIQSLCSALAYLAGKRNRWPLAKRNKPKLFIRVDDSHSYFPFT